MWDACEGEHVMFSVCPSACRVGSSGQMLPGYLMNGLSNLDETYTEYSTAHTEDPIRFWRSRSQQAVEAAKTSTSALAGTWKSTTRRLVCSVAGVNQAYCQSHRQCSGNLPPSGNTS